MIADRPKNIRIHLVVSRVRFHLLRFNSCGNFCDGGAICSSPQSPIRLGLPVLVTITAAFQMWLMKLDLLFLAKRMAFLSDETVSSGSLAIREVRAKERSDVRVVYAAKE